MLWKGLINRLFDMKKLFYSLLISFFSFLANAQNDSLSTAVPKIGVISADKLNIVYRGVSNPISISVPNCKSFTATAYGLTKKSEGKYWLAPVSGLYSIIKLDIELNNGSKIKEEHKFRIKGINPPVATINGKSCSYNCILEMIKDELFDSTIEFNYSNDFLLDLDLSNYKINGFTLKFSNTKKMYISGNKFNAEALNIIKKLKKGSIISIDNISYSFPGSENYLLPRLTPIKIMIVDSEKEVNYYESKEFIKDSLQRIKAERKLLKTTNQKK
jgi:hypothetical protein